MIVPPWMCCRAAWSALLTELSHRGGGERESGAFLLGDARRIIQAVYYDDLVPGCLDEGVVIFPSSGFTPLWDRCASAKLRVVADIHTHPRGAGQSLLDRSNPMIATPGHLAIIVPFFAQRPVLVAQLGLFEYLGDHRWRNHSGRSSTNAFLIQDKP